jgi:hypothetical protein
VVLLERAACLGNAGLVQHGRQWAYDAHWPDTVRRGLLLSSWRRSIALCCGRSLPGRQQRPDGVRRHLVYDERLGVQLFRVFSRFPAYKSRRSWYVLSLQRGHVQPRDYDALCGVPVDAVERRRQLRVHDARSGQVPEPRPKWGA